MLHKQYNVYSDILVPFDLQLILLCLYLQSTVYMGLQHDMVLFRKARVVCLVDDTTFSSTHVSATVLN